jgi:O-antigen/teichoic acid export membrane protein
MLIALATQAFRYAAEPFFFRTAPEQDSPRTFARVFHYYILFCLAIFLGVAAFSYEIVAFNFFGLADLTLIPERYWVGLEAVPILLGANLCLGAYLNLSIWFKLTTQTRYALLFTGTGAAITILGNVLFIPTYGYLACAWATLASYFTMCVLCYIFGQRNYPIPYRFGRLFAYTGLAVGLALLCIHLTGPLPPDPATSLQKLGVVLGGAGLVALVEWWRPLRF